MNLHRLELVSLSLFSLVVRTRSNSRGAELAHLGLGAASKRISNLETPSVPSSSAAIHGGACLIVTFKLKDSPAVALKPTTWRPSIRMTSFSTCSNCMPPGSARLRPIAAAR